MSSARAFGNGGRIARAEAAVDVLEGFFLVVRRILLERLDDGVVVWMSTTFTFLCPRRQDLRDDRLGERLEGARHDDLAVEHVGEEDLVARLLFLDASR